MAGDQQSIEAILAELAQPPSPAPAPSQAECASVSIDDILSQLEGKSAPNRPADPLQAMLAKVQAKDTSPVPSPVSPSVFPAPQILHELTEASQAVHKQAEMQRQEKRQDQERQATAWLKQLDPLSSDCIWFEQFARNYPSALEAAIVYLFAGKD